MASVYDQFHEPASRSAPQGADQQQERESRRQPSVYDQFHEPAFREAVPEPRPARQTFVGNVVEAGRQLPGGFVSGFGTAAVGAAALLHRPYDRTYSDRLRQAGSLSDEEITALYRDIQGDDRLTPRDQFGLTAALTDIVERGADPSQVLDQIDFEDIPAVRAGRAVEEAGRGLIPPQTGYENSIGGELGAGLGSLGTGVALSALGGPAVAGGFFALQGSGEAAGRAMDAGPTPRQQLDEFIFGAAPGEGPSETQIVDAGRAGLLPGLTDTIPVETLLGRLPLPGAKVVADMIERVGARPVADAAGRIGMQAMTEALQEGGQTALQNLIAREVYDPTQRIGQDVLPSAGIGGGVGGIAGAGAEVLRYVLRGAAGRRGGSARTGAPEPAPLTPEDRASPIPDDVIAEGRAVMEQATNPVAPTPQPAGTALDVGGDMPAAPDTGMAPGTAVEISDPGGPQDGMSAEVIGSEQGMVRVRMQDGTERLMGAALLRTVEQAGQGQPVAPPAQGPAQADTAPGPTENAPAPQAATPQQDGAPAAADRVEVQWPDGEIVEGVIEGEQPDGMLSFRDDDGVRSLIDPQNDGAVIRPVRASPARAADQEPVGETAPPPVDPAQNETRARQARFDEIQGLFPDTFEVVARGSNIEVFDEAGSGVAAGPAADLDWWRRTAGTVRQEGAPANQDGAAPPREQQRRAAGAVSDGQTMAETGASPVADARDLQRQQNLARLEEMMPGYPFDNDRQADGRITPEARNWMMTASDEALDAAEQNVPRFFDEIQQEKNARAARRVQQGRAARAREAEQRGRDMAQQNGADPSPSAASGPREIGVNEDGFPIFEDERGVRSTMAGDGVRITERVGIRPTRSGAQVTVDPSRRDDRFKTVDELMAASDARVASEAQAGPTVTVEPLRDKSVIVRGLTEADGDRFTSIRGRALWNAKEQGWVFSKKWEGELREALGLAAPAQEAAPEAPAASTEGEGGAIPEPAWWSGQGIQERAALYQEIGIPPGRGRIARWQLIPQARRREILDAYDRVQARKAAPSTEAAPPQPGPAVDFVAVGADGRSRNFTPNDPALAATAQPPTSEPQAGNAPEPSAPSYGSENALVSRERYQQLRQRMKRKLSGAQLNSGIDPEILTIGAEMAIYHLEAGTRAFVDVSRALASDLDMSLRELRPYLRSWYNGARDMMEDSGRDVSDMDGPDAVIEALGRIDADGVQVRDEGDAQERGNQLRGDDAVSTGVPVSDEPSGATDVPPPDGDGSDRVASEGEADRVPGNVRDADRGGADGQQGDRGRAAPERSTGTGVGGSDGVSRGRSAESRGGQGSPVAENFRIEPGALQENRGPKQKARDNIAAIKLLRQIEAEGRPATREEQAALARYVGWGGLKGAFPDTQGNFAKGFADIGAELKVLLTDTEYDTARRSLQYAHYTAENVVRSMWDAAQRLGFKGGKVFEPGMGVGNFAGLMPDAVAGQTAYSGLELDHTTARIARLLYPKWGVRQDDFTRAPLPKDTFDLVIGNPPFADISITSDPAYAKHGFLLHDYFFAKSLDAVRPGGLLMFISSAGTMNKQDTKAREYFAERADLVGAIRLPGNAFEGNAGTSVTTDIVILRKRVDGEASNRIPFVETRTVTLPDKHGNMKAGASNTYFIQNPEMILGEQGFFDKLYAGRYAVRAPKGFDLDAALAEAVGRLPQDVMTDWQGTTERAEVDFGTQERKEGSYYLGPDGRVWQQTNGVGRMVPQMGREKGKGGKSKDAMAKIEAMIPMRDALRAVYDADLAQDTENAARARQRLNEAYDAFVAEFGPINKKVVTPRKPTRIQLEAARQEAREMARAMGEPWIEGSFDDSEMLRDGASAQKIAAARQEAREQAKRLGRDFDEGSFDPAAQPDVEVEKLPNVEPFDDDPEHYRLRAIEDYDEKTGTGTKSRVFTENVITREVEPEINSVGDALLHTLNKVGWLDITQVANSAGKGEAEVIAELGDSIFQNPERGGQWVTRDDYLSGNVRAKLRQAEAAAERDSIYRRNVEALKAVQPMPLGPSQIRARLGMPWIPTGTYEQFATDSLGLTRMQISYTPKLALYAVNGDNDSFAARTEFGTEDYSASELLAAILNKQKVEVRRTTKNPDGSTESYLDATATQAAQEKVTAIQERFNAWVWSDDARTQELADIYNEQYNSLVDRVYDGSFLTTPGISTAWRWRPHQLRVVSRIMLSGNTYMAHAVGAGKTSAMIGAGMEMRRLGLVRKPMYVVPNHMLGQFTKEFYEQYPTARIQVADERQFHTDKRKQFIADVSTSDLDAVIITHSAFGKVPISDSYSATLLSREIDDLRELLAEIGNDQENRITRAQIERQVERLEQRMAGRQNASKDQVFTFEEMGVDFLFVDEAHLFRKLDFATRMGSVKGINPEGSGRSWDLFTKVQYLNEQNPGRSLVMASGTPITNTMAELYTVSRYIQPEALEERGLSHFDAWAGAFGTTESAMEQTPAGTYKQVTRFSRFLNMNMLSAMVRQNMDVVTSKELEQYVTRPALRTGGRQFHAVPRSTAMMEYQDTLARRMQIIEARKGKPEKGDDIILKVIGDGRLAAIDMRLVNAGAKADEPSKLDRMIDNVFEIWERTKRQPLHMPQPDGYSPKPVDFGPTAQMIFANLGINGDRSGFSSHKHIKQELVRRGVPEAEIANIADAKNHRARQRLFNDMNEGKVRILIGSTSKMGTGVNAQRRLYAVHNLDPLWYPADDEQRNGRIIRQGNMNPEVEIHDYAAEGSYDSTMYQMMQRKAGFIEQFMRGDPNQIEIEDVGEAGYYEQAKALSTADPRVLQLTELRQELQAAERRKEGHEREVWALQQRIRGAENEIAYSTKRAAELQQDVNQRETTAGEAFVMVVGDKQFTDRAEAGEAVLEIIQEAYERGAGSYNRTIGRIGGFPLAIRRYGSGNYVSVDLVLETNGGRERRVQYNTSASGLVQSAESLIRRLDTDLATVLSLVEQSRTALADMQGREVPPFTGQPEIDRLRGEVAALERALEGVTEEGQTPPPNAVQITEGEDDGRYQMPRSGRGGQNGSPLRLEPDVAATDGAPAVPTAAAIDRMTGETNEAGLRARLDRVGLSGKIGTRLVERIREQAPQPEGRYVGRMIEIALGAPDKMAVLNHEIVHALRDLGLIRDMEWRVLSRAAEADGDRMQDIRERYADQGLTDESLVEEAIADMHADWAAGTLEADTAVGRAMQRIARFFEALGNWVRGIGFQTAADVFGRIESGEISARPEPARDADGRFAPEPDLEMSRFAMERIFNSPTAGLAPKVDVKIKGADRQMIHDMGAITRWTTYPRMIATKSRSFARVYQAAVQQFRRRDQMVSGLSTTVQAYTDLSEASKRKVNQVLEIGRLAGQTWKVAEGAGLEVQNTVRTTELSKMGAKIALTPEEAAGYSAVRRTMNDALDLFRDQMIKEFGLDPSAVRTAADIAALIKDDMRPAEKDRLATASRVVREIEQAKRTGYVPFNRYGDAVVAVRVPDMGGAIDPVTGKPTKFETVFSTTVETGGARDAARRAMGKDTLGDKAKIQEAMERAKAWVASSRLDPAEVEIVTFQSAPKALEDGDLSAADVDMLATMASLAPESHDRLMEAFQTAQQARGFRAHFFGARNVPGYTPDFERAIADYIVGIGGYLARREQRDAWESAIEAIPPQKRKEREYAERYRDYVNNPAEEFAFVRQLGFLYMIAGNLSTAALNLTQVPIFTAPYLSMFGSHASIAKNLGRAYADATLMLSRSAGIDMFSIDKAPADVRPALLEAQKEGRFLPLQTYEMMGTAHNRTAAGRAMSRNGRKVMDVIALSYSWAERTNRIASFIAAYRMAAASPDKVRVKAREIFAGNQLAADELLTGFSPTKFANWVVDETHFVLGKTNRPQGMRGPGAAIFQFKSFTLNALELQRRMLLQYGKPGRVAFGLHIAALLASSGLWGLPFADDATDAFEAIWEFFTGLDKDLQTDVRRIITEVTGSPDLAEVVARGGLRMTGVDMSSRIGMGDLLPGTSGDVAGVPHSLFIDKPLAALQHVFRGNGTMAAAELLPNFLANPIRAMSYAEDGVRSRSGNVVIEADDVTAADVGLRALGFTSARIANQRDRDWAASRADYATSRLRTTFYRSVARAMAEAYRADSAGDLDARGEAMIAIEREMERVERHNANAPPHLQIELSQTTLRRYVQNELVGSSARDDRAPVRNRGNRQELNTIYNLDEAAE